MSVASKFQKIHSDLIIETESKNFVTSEQKQKIDGAIQAENNLSDLTDVGKAVESLGLAGLLSTIAEMSIVNDRVPVVGGKFTLSKEPLNNKIIYDICMVVSPQNLIISEEYNALYIDGTQAEFKIFNEEYEGNEVLVSYISIAS